jgi:nicotinate-nucleotide--dimethylbenzimidazole phosphoribosyltransferase
MDKTLEAVCNQIVPLDEAAMLAARARQDLLTKPRGSLGRLEALAVQVAGITGAPIPRIRRKAIIVMAADHGIAAERVSAYPPEVTRQMVCNFLQGGAAINALARQAGVEVIIVDMGVAGESIPGDGLLVRKIARGTANIALGPAMRPDQALAAIQVGIRIVNEDLPDSVDLIATGDMGIGNTSASAALLAALSGAPPDSIVGRGTGVDGERYDHKVAMIKRALAVNRPVPDDPVRALAMVGGFEIAGLAGVILASAAKRIPVVIDGFVSGAAALVATRLAPAVLPYLIAGHRSEEKGHQLLLEALGLQPLLDLGMRLGEGTGAVLGMQLVEAAVRCHAEMATFAEAGVSEFR